MAEVSPSPVAPVCQEVGQLELTCNATGIDHTWKFTVFPENMTHITSPVTSTGVSAIPRPVGIGTSMITFSRLSGPNVLPLISRITVSPVSSALNGTVVSCFDDEDSIATTTVQIIDSRQFGKTHHHGMDVQYTVMTTMIIHNLHL